MAIVRRIVWVRIFDLMFFVVIYYAGCKIEVSCFGLFGLWVVMLLNRVIKHFKII